MTEDEADLALRNLQEAIEESRELRRKLGTSETERFADAWVQGWEACVSAFSAVFDNLGESGANWVEVLTKIEACRTSLPKSLSPHLFDYANAALDDLWSAAAAGLQGDRAQAEAHALEARRKAAVLGGLLAS